MVNSKKAKTEETEAKNVNGVGPSRLTIHDSRLHIVLIILAGLIVYSNTFHVPFLYDDFDNLTNNPVIKSLDNFVSSSKGYDYNPRRFIGYLSFALNYHFGGLDVTGYHMVNVAIHLINSILVYFMVTLTFRTPFFRGQGPGTGDQEPENGSQKQEGGYQSLVPGSRSLVPSPQSLVALFSALLFAVHPIQTEAVTYIVQRFASLAAMFYLMSVVAYIKARIGNGPNGKKGIPYSRITFFLISLVSAVLAMKTKENAFTLPFVIVLYEFCFFSYSPSPIAHRLSSHDSLPPHPSLPHKGRGLGRGSAIHGLSRLTLLIPILLTMLLIPLSILGTNKPLGEIISDMSERLRAQSYLPRWDYLMTQLRVITTYIRLIFLPVNQNMDYDYPVSHSFFALPVLLSFIFLAALFGIAVYLVIKSKSHAKEDDSGQAGMTKKEKGLAALCCHSGLSGIFSRFMSHISRPSDDSQFEIHVSHPLTDSQFTAPPPIPPPPGGRVREGVHVSQALSDSRFTSHDSRPLRLVGFGILWFFITLSVESSVIPIADVIVEHRLYLPLAGALIALTTSAFMIAEKLEINWKGTVNALIIALSWTTIFLSGAAFARNMVWQDEVRLWKDVAMKSPNKPRAHYNLGFAFQARNMPDKAMEQYLIAVNLRPDYSVAHNNLGIVYQARNMPDKAMEQYLIAIKIKPDFADAHNNLGVICEGINMFEEAVKQFLIALRLQPDLADAHFNLGFVYYKMGQVENARRELTEGLKIKPEEQRAQQLLKAVNREP
jgi:Tfp pilus assembly protein PilF